MKNTFVGLLLFILAFPMFCSAQAGLNQELHFEVNQVYPPVSISKEKLKAARTLTDLDKRYKPSWVREYRSVEIRASHKGSIRKVVSNNDVLSQEQKNLMEGADPGTGISVVVQYLPENTLKNNDVKQMDFTLTVDPDEEASYPGGTEQLRQFLQEQAIAKIPAGSFINYDLAAVKFAIDEAGRVVDAHIYWPSRDSKIDELLLSTICNMPNWNPAGYTDGTRVTQEFVLTVGSMENCAVNLLNIRQD